MFNIPIIINNKNLLTTTRQLVLDLIDRGYNNIYILDMNSTYPELIEWYTYMEANEIIKVIHSDSTKGHRALWEENIIERFRNNDWIVYTDSDIILNPYTPYGFIEEMIDIIKHSAIKKIGLAIDISDLPDTELTKLIKTIETKYWLKPVPYKGKELYVAPVDTTFCVIDPKRDYDYTALRIAGEFTCKHQPWYQDWNNLTEEEQYYFKHADSVISTTAGHYKKWKENKKLL